VRTVRRGFTLVELIVVIVVIGIIAAIAIARFVSVKEAVYIATMKSDLRNLAIYEEFYATENSGNYFAANGTAHGFTPSLSVTITATDDPGPPSTWHATAVHAKTPKTCSIGGTNPSESMITCT
jgi:prepilin-type N-terminal cleavage/methylation domain-containing protein